MASSFDVLPPEIAQKCVEFLDFDLVTGELKGVSKATRGVARRALTRGRWKPFRYVAEQGLAAVSEIDQRAFFLEPPAAVCVPCREAWALDPALVIRLICDWDTAHLNTTYLKREMAAEGVYQGRFLWIVEPAESGLSRIVSALECTYLIQGPVPRPSAAAVAAAAAVGAHVVMAPSKWPFFPFPMLNAWNQALTFAAGLAEDPNKVYEVTPGVPISFDALLGRDFMHSEAGPLVGYGLEAWSDPKLAARFAHRFHVRYGHTSGYANEMEMYFGGAALWSADWVDRTKAGAFMAEMGRIWNAHWSDPDE